MTNRTPLDDVEFLARSAHRVEVIQTLTSGPWTRPDLHDETGISQPTLGRILGSFQDRGWVKRDGRAYVLTAFGELVAEVFSDLLSTVDTVQRLGAVISLLPTEQMDFDVRLLGDATVTTPTTGDAFRHVRRVEALVYDANHLRLLSTTVAPGSPEEHLKRIEKFLAGGQVAESVLTVNTLDQSMADPEVAELFAEVMSFDRVRLYLYEGTIPQMVGISDGVTFLVPFDKQGMPAAVIETTNETIRSWAEATIDEYIAKSRKLTADGLPH